MKRLLTLFLATLFLATWTLATWSKTLGQNGSLTFYTTQRFEDPRAVLRDLVILAEPEHILEPFRSVGEDTEWEDFLQDGPGVRHQMLPRPRTIEQFVECYREGTSLSSEMPGSPLAKRIQNGVVAAIPSDIRGDYAPTDLMLRMGYHDLFDTAEHEEGLLIARPFLSIVFFGYSSPNDWNGFREAVFRVPEVRAAKAEFEAITGPLDECIIWSV